MRSNLKIICYLLVFALVITVVTVLGYSSYSEPEAPHFVGEQPEEKKFVFDYRIDMEILDAMDAAEEKAKEYASGRLDGWISELMVRTDSFLEDYFNLLNVKKREMSTVWHTINHKINKGSPSSETVLMNELMVRFEAEVLDRSEAKRVLDDIGKSTATVFMNSFEQVLDTIQDKYSVPEQDWEKHISNLCDYAADFEARQVSIAAKISIASSAGIGAEIVYKIVSSIVKKISGNLAMKAGTKVVSSTGAKLTGAIPFIGAAVTVAVIGWDFYDSYATAERNKRDMRVGVEQYFQEMKEHLLGPAPDGIIGSIISWKREVQGRIQTQ